MRALPRALRSLWWRAAILDFAQSTYDAGATLAGWNREALAYP